MADETEAACLLHKGAQYPRRLGLLGPDGQVFAGFRHGAFALYFGDDPYYHFDLDGRWQRALIGGVHYVKGLDASTDAIERPREGSNLVLRRRTLPFAEAADLDARIRQVALDLGAGLGQCRMLEPPEGVSPIAPDELGAFLDRVALWDASAWFAQRERYLDAYTPPMFIPPDGPNSAVIQGPRDSARRLAFGGAPIGEKASKTPDDPAESARRVARLLGRRVALCKRIALVGDDLFGDGGEHLTTMLHAAHEAFPVTPESSRRWEAEHPDAPARIETFSALCDDFSSPPPAFSVWDEWPSLRLRRVHLAVESGCAAVRELYGKAWPGEQLRQYVAALKSVGLAASVLVLVGAGGAEYAERHLKDTVSLVGSLDLGANDFLYLLDAAEVGGPAAVARFEALGHPPLSGPAMDAQRERFKAAFEPLRKERKVKVLAYTMEKQ